MSSFFLKPDLFCFWAMGNPCSIYCITMVTDILRESVTIEQLSVKNAHLPTPNTIRKLLQCDHPLYELYHFPVDFSVFTKLNMDFSTTHLSCYNLWQLHFFFFFFKSAISGYNFINAGRCGEDIKENGMPPKIISLENISFSSLITDYALINRGMIWSVSPVLCQFMCTSFQ